MLGTMCALPAPSSRSCSAPTIYIAVGVVHGSKVHSAKFHVRDRRLDHRLNLPGCCWISIPCRLIQSLLLKLITGSFVVLCEGLQVELCGTTSKLANLANLAKFMGVNLCRMLSVHYSYSA